MQVQSDAFLRTPPRTIRTRYCDTKRSSRKTRQPQKTPRRCDDTNNSVVVKLQLVSGTPTPCLKIRTSGTYQCILKARRRLFSQNDSNWNQMEEEMFDYKTMHGSHIAVPVPTESAAESDEEPDLHDTFTNADRKHRAIYKVKVCASCKTKKTPLWRDAEDGTPYCNACGIRFKKYRICCPICSYIPRKDENFGNICCQCGSTLLYYNKM